jgi:hypothetical protein
VKEVETPDLQAIRDGALIEAERQELQPRHHPVLPRRQFGQRNVGCAELTPIIRLNSAHPVYVGASDGRQERRGRFVTPQCAVRHI